MAQFNFSAGPAAIPTSVKQRIQQEFDDFAQTGCHVAEISHRGKPFIALAENTITKLKRLLHLSDDYVVVFSQGGATQQFSALVWNLVAPGECVSYARTGHWSAKAARLAALDATVQLATDGAKQNYAVMDNPENWQVDPNSAFLHVTPNETIHGRRLGKLPHTDIPVIGDFSSCLLGDTHDITDYAMAYASAQKNLGIAGITVIILRRDLLGRSGRTLPPWADYQAMLQADSMGNTPCTYAWYVLDCVLDWLEEQGGVNSIAQINQQKAEQIYQIIDRSEFYRAFGDEKSRSIMNIPFFTPSADLDTKFVQEAEKQGLLALKGHRALGGLRASLYNAMPLAGAKALAAFMETFEHQYG